jgi:predicted nucleic acid-binding protein
LASEGAVKKTCRFAQKRYLSRQRIGVKDGVSNDGVARYRFFACADSAGELTVLQTTAEDLNRAADLLDKYADSKVDFVDCVIAAMAERLKLQRILTIDRRHFGLFRPKHCQFFEIVP